MASTDARPVPIKNTAFRAVFPIYDADGDLVTGAATLDSEVSKDQGAFADCTNEATEIATSSGIYYLDLTSSEMNADCVAVIVKTGTAGAKTTVLVFYPEETGDINVDVTAYGGAAGTFSGGRPEVNTTHAAGTAWASGAITSSVFATGAITAGAIAADAIGASELAADAVAEIADAVWDEDATGHQTQGTFGQAIGDPVADTNTIYKAVVSDATGATVGVDVAAVLVDTAEIGAAGAGLTEAGGDGDHLTAINLPNQTMDITGNITGNLSGSVGSVTGNVGGNVIGSVGSLGTQAKLDVNAEADTALADYDPPTKAELDAAVANVSVDEIQASALADLFNTDSGTTYAAAVAGSPVKEIADNAGGSSLTAADIADAVWDEDATGHQTQGTFGQAIGDPVADTNTIYKATVTDATGATVGVDVVDLKTQIGTAGDGLTAINLPDQTMNITGNITGNVSGSVGSVTGAVGSVTGDVTVGTNNDKTGYRLSSTGVDDVLRTALTEGYAADGAAPTLEQFLFMVWTALSEFAISGTTITCKKLDGTTTSMTFTLDDATNPTSRTRAT